MNTRLIRLREQRTRLIERAAHQREEIALGVAAMHGPIAIVDQGLGIARYIKSHPVIIAASAALVIATRPRRSLSWVRRGLMLWQTWRWLATRY